MPKLRDDAPEEIKNEAREFDKYFFESTGRHKICFTPKPTILWLHEHNLLEKQAIYCRHYSKLYPSFDNTCSKEEYMEKLDKAIEEIEKKH